MPNSPPATKITAPRGSSVVVRTIDTGQPLQWLAHDRFWFMDGSAWVLTSVGLITWLAPALIMELTFVGFATALIGLVLLVPLLGHASWHAYRDLLDVSGVPEQEQT